jgi:hypothetical protein
MFGGGRETRKKFALWHSLRCSPNVERTLLQDKAQLLQSPLAHPLGLRLLAALPRCKSILRGTVYPSLDRYAGQAETAYRESALQTTDELPPSTLRAVPVT